MADGWLLMTMLKGGRVMLSEVIGRLIDRQRWLDGVGDVLERVTSATFDHLGPVSKPLEDLLHGTPAGHPVHAALTDIPIGSWTATLALDMAGIEDGADLALDVGLVGAISAALVGLVDWRYTTGSQRRRGVAHALFNVSGTLLYGLSSFQRHRGGRAAWRRGVCPGQYLRAPGRPALRRNARRRRDCLPLARLTLRARGWACGAGAFRL